MGSAFPRETRAWGDVSGQGPARGDGLSGLLEEGPSHPYPPLQPRLELSLFS